VEQRRDLYELVFALRAESTEVRTTVAHLVSDMSEVKQDLRRLDDRVFQLMLVMLATLAASIASVVANVLS
jgi:hypothetical protein